MPSVESGFDLGIFWTTCRDENRGALTLNDEPVYPTEHSPVAALTYLTNLCALYSRGLSIQMTD